MSITITPFTVESTRNLKVPLVGDISEEQIKKNHSSTEAHERLPITYWGIYLDDKQVSFVSSKELAEKTKLWMEKWLKASIGLVLLFWIGVAVSEGIAITKVYGG
jgi:hypothetical protein